MNDNSWRDFADCATADPDLFIFVKGGSSAPAKKICAACPVAAQCLQFAVDAGIREGVWGGLSGPERRGMQRTTVA